MATVTEKELIKYIANSSYVLVSTVKATPLSILPLGQGQKNRAGRKILEGIGAEKTSCKGGFRKGVYGCYYSVHRGNAKA